mgnify:CR=1 FL=1
MEKGSNYLEVNRSSWNKITDIHLKSDFYDLENFKKGKCVGNMQLRMGEGLDWKK